MSVRDINVAVMSGTVITPMSVSDIGVRGRCAGRWRPDARGRLAKVGTCYRRFADEREVLFRSDAG